MQEPTQNEAPQQPTQPAPEAPVASQPVAPATPYVENPGQTLGIIGIITNVMGIGIAGIVLGVMSRNKSREAGMPTTLGTVSLAWGIVITVLAVLTFIGIVLLMILGATAAYSETDSSYQATDSVYEEAPSATTEEDLFSN